MSRPSAVSLAPLGRRRAHVGAAGLVAALFVLVLLAAPTSASADEGDQAACLGKQSGDSCVGASGLGGECVADAGGLACLPSGQTGGASGSPSGLGGAGTSTGSAGARVSPGGSGSGASAGYSTGEGGTTNGLTCQAGATGEGGAGSLGLMVVGLVAARFRSVRRKP